MKSLTIAIALVGAFSVAPLQAALSVTVTAGSAQNSNGGEFLASPNPQNAQWAALGVTSPFETFCVEINEHLSFGSTYTATVASSADKGGNGGPSPDPISIGTSYLYRQFLSNPGAIGYNNTVAAAGDLQAAIWWLEQEDSVAAGILPNSVVLSAGSLNFLTAARTALGKALNSDLQADAAPFANHVGVLRLTSIVNGQTVFNQDILAPVPEPSTIIAGALLLIPVCAQVRRMRCKA